MRGPSRTRDAQYVLVSNESMLRLFATQRAVANHLLVVTTTWLGAAHARCSGPPVGS